MEQKNLLKTCRYISMKKQIDKFLNNKFCEIFLVILIVVNIVCLGFETDKTVYLQYTTLFNQIELVSVIIFTIEYILRLISLEKLKDIRAVCKRFSFNYLHIWCKIFIKPFFSIRTSCYRVSVLIKFCTFDVLIPIFFITVINF